MADEQASAFQGLRAASLSVTSRGLDLPPLETPTGVGGDAASAAAWERQSVGRPAFGQGSSLHIEPPAEPAGQQNPKQRQPEIAFSNRKAQLLHRWVGENAAAAAAAAAGAASNAQAADAQETQDAPAAHHN